MWFSFRSRNGHFCTTVFTTRFISFQILGDPFYGCPEIVVLIPLQKRSFLYYSLYYKFDFCPNLERPPFRVSKNSGFESGPETVISVLQSLMQGSFLSKSWTDLPFQGCGSIVHRYTVPWCTAQSCCAVLRKEHRIWLYCTKLFCIVLYCTRLYCVVLHCTEL